MIELDGSFGEGGGQIIRSSLALSLLTGQPFHLRKIRAGRAKGGLQPQHLMSVRAAAEISSETLSGDSPGSSDLTFSPGDVKSGRYHFPIRTAGATALVLHTIYLPLALRGTATSEVVIEGGTHVIKAPCFHHLRDCWMPSLHNAGLNVQVESERYGYYPRGGGHVRALVQPVTSIQPIKRVTRLALTCAIGFSATADLPEHISQRMARRLTERLSRVGIEAEIALEDWANGPACVVGLRFPELAPSPMFFALGERGKPADAVANELADEVVAYLEADAPIDEHTADQLLLPLAFATGESQYRTAKVSLHLTTNAAIIQQFVPCEIEITGEIGTPGMVRIVGIGV